MEQKQIILDTRSKRAIAIDRAKKAKTVYKNFNKEYVKAPNQADVEGYDTPRTKVKQKPKTTKTTKQVEKKETKVKSKKELKLPRREVLMRYFNKMDLITRFKDLTETRKLVKTQKEFEIWKKNPYAYDIEGVDTAPKEVYLKKIKVLQEKAGIDELKKTSQYKSRVSSNLQGFYEPLEHQVYIRPRLLQKFNKGVLPENPTIVDKNPFGVVAHELGHAYHYNVIEGKKTKKERFTFAHRTHKQNVAAYSKIALLKTPKTHIPFETEFKIKKHSAKQFARLSEQAMGITKEYKKNVPARAFNSVYRYIQYTHESKETMANFMATMVINRKKAKKEASIFYKLFRKAHKQDFKAFKKAEFEAVKYQFSKKDQEKLKKLFRF